MEKMHHEMLKRKGRNSNMEKKWKSKVVKQKKSLTIDIFL